MTFTPDRRPIKRISLYTGNPNHPRGLRDQIATLDGYRAYLFSQLDTRYALGWRRFMLHAPAGRPLSVGTAGLGFGLYHHHHLPDDVRAMLKRELSAWLMAHDDAVVGVYVGFKVIEAGRYHVTAEAQHEPDPENPADRAAFLLELEQWLAISPEPGQIGFGLDAARLKPEYLVGWADEMRARGVWVLGEAIPEVTANNAFSVEASLAPWWASYSFLIAPNRPHRQSHTWETESTEVIIGFQNGNITSDQQARVWHDKGYVLSSWGDTQDAYVLEASS